MSSDPRGIEPISALGALALTARLISSPQRARRAAVASRSMKHSRGCRTNDPTISGHARKVHQIIFEITQDIDRGFCAKCLTERILTQAESWDKLRANIRQAVESYYRDRIKPERIRLHIVRDETLALS